MPIDLLPLCRSLKPERTILLFGAGSSIPSGGQSGQELAADLLAAFKFEPDPTLTLSDAATIIEKRCQRRPLIEAVRRKIQTLRPASGLLALPRYDWASIFTTNYDTLIEQAYARLDKPLHVYSSNFDFTEGGHEGSVALYKIHGTIEKDVSDGNNSRIIITGADYDLTSPYRELLYNKLRDQLATHSVIIIGHSLSDPDLRPLIDEAIRLKSRVGAPGKITLFIFTKNDNQALIFEDRGFEVCFGGLDEFAAELLNATPSAQLVLSVTNDPLDIAPKVYPATIEVAVATVGQTADLNKMFNGRPASYADIARGWTFPRTLSDRLESQLASENKRIAYIIGAAGVGKTTAVRQTLSHLAKRDIRCFEHKRDFAVPTEAWLSVDRELRKRKENAVLFVDDAHEHMREVNRLAESLCANSTPALKLVLTSSRQHWNPRLKSPVIFSHGIDYRLSCLDNAEINSLLDLLDQQTAIAALVERQFLGFSRQERRRRLADRCQADMFVCLKHIFGFQTIDTIILQEYADLSEDYQEIYRHIAAMESAGVRVHRQLVIRTIGVEAGAVRRVLDDLDDIIDEYTVSEREGVYGWSIRHPEIARLIAKYKFSDPNEFYSLLDRVVSNLNPSYAIEVKSLDDICNNAGLGRIIDKSRQNVLLRKMISHAPNLRVPRHRLITNLISLEYFDVAETEIRVFEKELKLDGPVQRYKVYLKLGIADKTPGIMASDRAAFALEAAALAEAGIARFSEDKNMYRAYLEAGLAYFRHSGNPDVFNTAMKKTLEAQSRILDPDLQRIISFNELAAAKMMADR